MSTLNARTAIFRHASFCRPGKWLANVSAALGEFDKGWCVHATCVVDDFGDLMPVEIHGFTPLSTFGDWS